MDQKDFDKWNEVKKKVNSRKCKICILREIWWASLGINIGYEQDGTGNEYVRPVIVIKILNDDTCFVVPITTSKINNDYRISLGEIRGKQSFATISQLRMIDTRRLNNRMGKVDKDAFETIRNTLKEFL